MSFVIGLVLVFWLEPTFSSELRIASFSSMWPSTPGKVLDVRTVSLTGRGTAATHHAVVTFGYDVSGRNYTRSQILCECASFLDAENVLRAFSKKVPVPVFYDPLSPSLAVVQPRGFDAAFLTTWALEIASILLFLLVIPISLWTLRAGNVFPHARETPGDPRTAPPQRGTEK